MSETKEIDWHEEYLSLKKAYDEILQQFEDAGFQMMGYVRQRRMPTK